MRKITDFIIDKRYYIFALALICTIGCAFLSEKVSINYDIAKYLPDTSETRIGMNIMEEEFKGTETSTLNVMFEDLKDEEKEEKFNYLKSISGVKEVDYDSSDKYNKENYTLYVLTVEDTSDSALASKVYDEVVEHFKEDKMYVSGSIAQTNKDILPLWIVGLAIFCALIILIIMCDSYVEPFLFLISILMAVVLNNGTNIIFPNVSFITKSICAILQLALSMDYSIMLMNRYNQERQIEQDKVKAMKNAFHHAFQSISSSSVTTIVGLLSLIFMSFTIGRDLGLVLAKGVLFSLISIFLILPTFILTFDWAILKTKKKTPIIKMDCFGKMSYRFRFLSLPLFLLVFLGSFILKGNLGFDYTHSEEDVISKVFKENNQMAIIYNNEEEEKIEKYYDMLENTPKVEEVLGYGNTIHQNLPYSKLNQKLKDLGSDTNVDDYLLKIIYYHYWNKEEKNQISLKEMLSFLEDVVYNNKEFESKIDEDTKKNVEKLKQFVFKEEREKAKTASEIANILGMKKSEVEDLFVYYASKNQELKLSIPTFFTFLNQDVLTNPKYAKEIDKETISNLQQLSKFTDEKTLQKSMTAKEMSSFFEMDPNAIEELYQYYISLHEISLKMSIAEFSNFVLSDVLTDPNYRPLFTDDEVIENLQMLSIFSDPKIIERKMSTSELSQLFGVDEDSIKQLLILKYSREDSGAKLTISDLVKTGLLIKQYTHYLDSIDLSFLEEWSTKEQDDTTAYTVTQMKEVLGVEDVHSLYTLYAFVSYVKGETSTWQNTPIEFVDIILANKDREEVQSRISPELLETLTLLSNIMSKSVDGTNYSYQEMSDFIGISPTVTKNIYALFVKKENTTKLTPQEFVTFLIDHQKDSVLSGKVEDAVFQQLKIVQEVISSVLHGKTQTSRELSSILGVEQEKITLLYGLYDVKVQKKNTSMSLQKFVSFLLEDVIQNKEYSNKITSEKKEKLNILSQIMQQDDAKYTKEEIFSMLNKLSNTIDSNTIDVLYIYYGSTKEYDDHWTMTIEEFVRYLNEDILKDHRFDEFISEKRKQEIIDSKDTIKDAKKLLLGENYSRIVLNTDFDLENEEVFDFVQTVQDTLQKDMKDFYLIGDSPMAYDMSKSFDKELNSITIITMVVIFLVVAVTFRSLLVPIILVLTIQCAVYLTMGILSITGENVYFIAILIVQSILMGATIDYAILYTSYYLEHRKTRNVKDAIIESYNKSIHTILTSASILILVTLIVGHFSSAIASKICTTISQGTLCSTLLILILLPSVLAACDRFLHSSKER